MEKVLQIIAVFVLMMLIIQRFIRGREPAYQAYDYLTRLRPPLAPAITQRLLAAVFEAGQPDAFLADEVRQLRFWYKAEGSLTILRREKEMQELAAPLDCTAMSLDPEDGRIYLEAGGYIFVYGNHR